MILRSLSALLVSLGLLAPALAGAPTQLQIGADRTQSPAVVCVVNGGACVAPFGTYTGSVFSHTGDGSALNVKATAGSTLRSASARAADVANLLDFGSSGATVDATGSSDTTVAWAAALATGKKVVVPPGIYAACNITIPSSAEIEGMGELVTTVRATSGCNGDVFVGANAYSLFGTNSASGANLWGISQLTIDGNKANQTATGSAVNTVNGVAVYGAAWRLNNVLIKNVLGHGIRSEWYQYGENSGGIEASTRNVTIDTVGRNGWWFKGPHDAHNDKLIVIDAGQEADNTYMGVLAEGNTGGRWFDFHGWHRAAATNRVAYQFYSTGGNALSTSHFEGGRSEFYLSSGDKITNSSVYAPSGAAGSALGVIAGGNVVITGTNFAGKAGSSYYALQFGVAGGSAVQNVQVTGGNFNEFDVSTPFNFINDGGYNTIRGRGYTTNTSGSTTFGGTRNSLTLVDYIQTGTALNAQPPFSPIAQTADGTAANGVTRGTGAVDLQQFRFQNNQVALGSYSAILGGYGNSAAGNYATLAGGNQNVASGNDSTVCGGDFNLAAGSKSVVCGGAYGTARGQYGRQAFASGTFDGSTSGMAQRGDAVLRGLGASASVIRLTSDGATAGSANCFNIPDATAYGLKITLTGRDVTTPANSFTWSMPIATLLRGSGIGTTTLTLGTPVTLATNSWAPTISAAADTTNGCLNLSFTPPAGNTDTIHGVARIESVEVQ